jgi:cytochrome P450
VAGGLVAAAVEVEGVDLFPNPKKPICVPLNGDFWGEKETSFFNAFCSLCSCCCFSAKMTTSSMTFVSGGGSRFLCLAVKVEDTGRRPPSSRRNKTALTVGERKGKRRPRCGTTVNESSKTTTASTNTNNSNNSKSNKNVSKDLELAELLFGAASTSFALTVNAITSGLDFVQKVTSTEKPSSKYPPGPDFDSAFEMGQNPLKFIEKVKSRYGPVAGLRLAGENVILVSKPSVAKQVLIDDEASFTKKGTAFFPSSRLAGDGLLVTDGDVWRSQRRLSNPAFRKAAVETYAKAMNECIEETIRTRWRTNGERDIYEDFNEVTLQVVCRTLFGEDAVGTKGKEIVDSIRVAFEYFAKRSSGIEMILPEWFPLPSNISFNDAVDRLDNAVYAIIDKRLAEMEEPCFIACATQEMDLLDRLLSASLDDLVEDEEDRVLKGAMASSSNDDDDDDAVTNNNRKKMSRKQLRDEVMTLIVAGQETSAIVLSWAVAFVAKDESFGERIAKEATEARILASKRLKKIPLEKEQEECTIAEEVNDDDDNCKEPDSETIIAQTELTFESIKDLPFTEAIILETMRLKPPAYIVGRSNSISDVHLDENNKYDIPRGSTILVSPYLAHRDGQYWSKPNEFDPNRWLALDPETNQPYARTALRGMGYKNTYFPFGAGPRACVGAQFAMLEAIILLACSCEKRRFDLLDDTNDTTNNNNRNAPGGKGGGFPKDAAGITLRPESPVRMKVSAIRRKDL